MIVNAHLICIVAMVTVSGHFVQKILIVTKGILANPNRKSALKNQMVVCVVKSLTMNALQEELAIQFITLVKLLLYVLLNINVLLICYVAKMEFV
jgi:hypothetical protein